MKLWIKIFILILLLEDVFTVYNFIFRRGEYYFIFDTKMNIILDCSKYEKNISKFQCLKKENIFWKSYRCLGKNKDPLYLSIADNYEYCGILSKKIDKKRKSKYINSYLRKDEEPLEITDILEKNN